MLLKTTDLERLKWGAACLGSGGGGDPYLEALYTEVLMEKNGPIHLMDLSDLDNDAIVMPVAFVGAPIIGLERLSSEKEFINLYQAVKEEFGEIGAFVSCEIGGGNAFTPLILACLTNKPALDADMLGRAFPEIQMSSCTLFGYPPGLSFMVSSKGIVEKKETQDPFEMERMIRDFALRNGSSALVSTYIMKGYQAKKYLIQKSYTQALNLSNYEIIGHGMINDIDQTIKNGFQVGHVRFGEYSLYFQNEYLMACQKGRVVESTPDILMLLEEDTDQPIPVDKLMFGLRVKLIKIDSSPLWKTEAGLKLVGPQAFGFKI